LRRKRKRVEFSAWRENWIPLVSCTCTWRRERMMRQWHGLLLRWWTLPFLLLVTDSSCFRLQITNLAKVESHSTSSKRVRFRFSSIFLKSCTQPSYQSVQAPPSLPQRTWTRCWRVRVPVKGADRCVHFRLPKLIQVPTLIAEKENTEKKKFAFKTNKRMYNGRKTILV